MARNKQLYADNGVEISKATINVGDEVTLLYSGLLAKSGADSVYAHIGYGENWEDKAFVPMEKVEDVFKATIKVSHPEKLNVAFKDSVDNWDNNSQQNYSFDVTAKASKSSASKEKKATAKASSSKSEAVKEKAETKAKTAKAKSTSAKSATKSTAKKSASDKATTTKKSSAAKKNSK